MANQTYHGTPFNKPGLQILVVFTIVAPVVWTGGLLYSALTGAPLQRGLLKVWSVVIRVPGE